MQRGLPKREEVPNVLHYYDYQTAEIYARPKKFWDIGSP